MMDAFSHRCGRIRLIAKGVKRKGNTFAPLLRPFQPLLLSWQGKGGLKNLTQVDSVMQLPGLTGDYLFSAFYLNELLQHLLQEQEPFPDLFIQYAETLSQLTERLPLEVALRRFEWRLLCELGFAPDLTRDHDGYWLRQNAIYCWHVGLGFQVASGPEATVQDRGLTAQQVHDILHLVAGRQVLENEIVEASAQLEGLRLSAALKHAKVLFRQAIDSLLQGRVLKSRELIVKFRALDTVPKTPKVSGG
ncbi:MAG: DNA repair protein RecO [Hahellaceae bacterium]|nr:DNA repair protein RecO [Hahellaceae bacterium]